MTFSSQLHVAQEDRLVEAVVDAQLLKLGVGRVRVPYAARPRGKLPRSPPESIASFNIRSIGPPGTTRVTAKTSNVIPRKVGMISRKRRMK